MNVRNSEKIQDKWLLFQRFVTSIVGAMRKGYHLSTEQEPVSVQNGL